MNLRELEDHIKFLKKVYPEIPPEKVEFVIGRDLASPLDFVAAAHADPVRKGVTVFLRSIPSVETATLDGLVDTTRSFSFEADRAGWNRTSRMPLNQKKVKDPKEPKDGKEPTKS